MIFAVSIWWWIGIGVLVLLFILYWYGGSLQGDPVEGLEPLLVQTIPEAVRKLKVSEPVCCLRLYYYDSHAPAHRYGLNLKLLTEARREELLRTHGGNAPFYLWASGEENCDVSGGDLHSFFIIDARFSQVYELLTDEEHDEEEVMETLRAMLHRVAQKLNELDWSMITTVTNDFVVATADGSQTFADDEADPKGSIPPDKLALLRAREFLGPGDQWDRV